MDVAVYGAESFPIHFLSNSKWIAILVFHYIALCCFRKSSYSLLTRLVLAEVHLLKHNIFADRAANYHNSLLYIYLLYLLRVVHRMPRKSVDTLSLACVVVPFL